MEYRARYDKQVEEMKLLPASSMDITQELVRNAASPLPRPTEAESHFSWKWFSWKEQSAPAPSQAVAIALWAASLSLSPSKFPFTHLASIRCVWVGE